MPAVPPEPPAASSAGSTGRAAETAPRRHASILLGRAETLQAEPVQAALRELRSLGYELETQTMAERLENGQAPAVAAPDLVVVAGGDGTVREGAAEAHRTGATLALLPLGTANDLARTLGVPLEGGEAVRLLREGVRRRIDLGRCNGRYFCNVASLGLSAKVASRLSGERKKRWGPLAYAREFWDSIKTRRAFRVHLQLDGEVRSFRALQVGIASGETQGGGTRVSPAARIDDGLFCVYVVEPQKPLRLLLMALSLKIGAHDLWSGAHFFEARRVRVETKRPRRINIDGDLVERTPAEFEILPGALEVLVPAQTVPASHGTID